MTDGESEGLTRLACLVKLPYPALRRWLVVRGAAS